MNRQMILMTLVSVIIILLLIIPALKKPPIELSTVRDGVQSNSLEPIDLAAERGALHPETIIEPVDKEERMPLVHAYTEPAEGGFRLKFDEGEALYSKSVAEDAMGDIAVHLVEHEIDSQDSDLGWVKQYDLVVVKPDSARIETYPLFMEDSIDHYFHPIVKLLNENEAMFIRRSKEGEAIQYDLAVLQLDNGIISAMPAFWKVQNGSEDYRDFLLSANYERNGDGHVVEVMLTSYRGKRWLMDMEKYKLIGHKGQTYPAAGDPGSSPPRPLMYPSPDLEKFAYNFTEKDPIYISNHYMIADSKSSKVLKLFSIDDSMQLSDSGLVWNKESSRFFLEYAKKGEEMGTTYDTGPVVFAQQIAFYDSDGEKMRVLQAAQGERLNVYNWLDEHRLLVESYRPVQRASGGWSKGDIIYKEYDLRTGKLTAFRKERDAGKLANGETVALRKAGGIYDSKAFVYIDHKSKKIWTLDVKGRTHQSGGQFYIDVSDTDMQHIFEWDDEAKSLRPVYSTSSSEQQLRQALGDWLILEDRGASSFLYLNTKPVPDLNEEGLPVFSGQLPRFSGNEWWNENSDTLINLPGNEIRAQAKSRYGTLRIRSSEGELEYYKGARKYYGRYDVEFTNTAGIKTSLPSLEKAELELEQPVGEMRVLSFDGFDVILFVTKQQWVRKSYDGEFSNVYAYGITEDGEAMQFAFRYAIPGDIQLADSIGMIDTEAATGTLGQSVILQSYMGEKRVELAWTADVKAKTLTLTGLKDRTEEYDGISTVVERYANRLEQALGLTDIALPEGKMDEAKLRSLFTEKAWNNPGFQRLKTDFAKLEKQGNPSRAFALQPINARYDEYGNIRVTFALNLFYAVGWVAHLEAMLKLDEYEWTFHDFGKLETEYLEGYKELDDNLGMKGYNGLVIPDALER